MARRIIGIVVALLGATAIVLGVLSATSWRTSDTVTATSPSADVPFVVLEPGVAGIVDDQVDVVVTAADPAQQVTVITGRDVDVDGWLADAAQQRLVDVVDWETMVTQDVEGVTTDLPSPVGNDMWLETRQGTGELAFAYEVPTTGRQTLLVVRDAADGPAPTVSLTWQREVTTPYYQPLLTGGIAGVVLGLGLIVWSFFALPGRRREAEPAEVEGAEVEGAGTPDDDAETTALAALRPEHPVVGEPSDPPTAETAVLTRRQRRELRESGAEVGDGPGAYDGLRDRLAAVDVERIASEIAPVDSQGKAPDDPDSYPTWLRAHGEDAEASEGDVVEADGGTDDEASHDDVAPVAKVTWSERWGVATSSEPLEVEPEPIDEAEPIAEPGPIDEDEPAAEPEPTDDNEEHR